MLLRVDEIIWFSVFPIANLLFFFPFPSECAFLEWWNRSILSLVLDIILRLLKNKDKKNYINLC